MSEEYGQERDAAPTPERLLAPAARPWAPGPRDALVTGMGFCLPGAGDEPVRTAGQVWATAATGASHVERDGFHHGTVRGAREAFGELLPDIPSRYLRSYADVHLYGLVSLVEACRDAGLDHAAGALRGADVLTARAGVDSNYDSYRAWHDADPATISPKDAKSLFVRLLVAGTSSDVGPVQAALLGSTGANYTVSCGCASSSVLLGIARTMIGRRRDRPNRCTRAAWRPTATARPGPGERRPPPGPGRGAPPGPSAHLALRTAGDSPRPGHATRHRGAATAGARATAGRGRATRVRNDYADGNRFVEHRL
ncbi:hypothetical protein SCALM49S_05865 [Streptomyces californicus]